MPSVYIVPTDILTHEMFTTMPSQPPWNAHSVPGDPSHVLLTVQWGTGANASFREVELEAMPGVLPLGLPWAPLPAEAVPVLAAIAALQEPSIISVALSLPQVDAPPDSVGVALHKIGWRLF
jgi:hypothetical protein